MFTGIIEETGKVAKIQQSANNTKITIFAKIIMENICKGDSVAVNGVCLTVTEISKSAFSADIIYETLQKTNMGTLKVGDEVNLERALKASDRLSGHIVNGHVDGKGMIRKIIKQSGSYKFLIDFPEELNNYIVYKGSICVDGISLTIASVEKGSFSVAVIPHTFKSTTLKNKKERDKVNLEVDILAKYIEKYFRSSGIKNSMEDNKKINEFSSLIDIVGGISSCN